LRQIGVRAADLDAVGKAYLNLYVRLVAKLDLLDRHFAEVGLLKANGDPQAAVRFYVSLANSTRLALARLEEHLRTQMQLGPDPLEAIAAEGRRVRELHGGS